MPSKKTDRTDLVAARAQITKLQDEATWMRKAADESLVTIQRLRDAAKKQESSLQKVWRYITG